MSVQVDTRNFWEVVEARLDRAKTKTFVFAGRAHFTLRNSQTGSVITFRVTKPRGPKAVKYPPELYWVALKYNEDTTDGVGWMNIGYVMSNSHEYRITRKQAEKLTRDRQDRPQVAKAFEQGRTVFNWFINNLFTDRLPDALEVYHEGRCGRCAKRLTVPGSIEVGYGPECIDIMGGLK